MPVTYVCDYSRREATCPKRATVHRFVTRSASRPTDIGRLYRCTEHMTFLPDGRAVPEEHDPLWAAGYSPDDPIFEPDGPLRWKRTVR